MTCYTLIVDTLMMKLMKLSEVARVFLIVRIPK